jgi:polyhydroxybutyrate depolymerase
MLTSLLMTMALALGQTDALGPGDHVGSLQCGGLKRTYHVHVPANYDCLQPTPLVLALHGLSMDARMMAKFTGLNKVADREGFVVVYPDGTGPVNVLRGWNAGAFPGDDGKERPDDVAFLTRLLDEIERQVHVDRSRIFATGMSNGAMMAYRLAGALSARIAAIAPVAGTLPVGDWRPDRAVPIIHFHGTADTLVPIGGPKDELARVVKFKSVDDSIQTWVKLNGCTAEPVVSELPAQRDKYKVTCKTYNHGRGDAEVVLYIIDGGGHSWPGMHLQPSFLGPSTDNINASELMWQFFKKHPRR